MIRFHVRKGCFYTTFTEYGCTDSVGVYMKTRDPMYLPWGGCMDYRIAKFLQAKPVKLVMDAYSTDVSGSWSFFSPEKVLVGCLVPMHRAGRGIVFAIIKDGAPLIV